MWLRVLLHCLILLLLLADGSPGAAAAVRQAASGVDAHAIAVEDGEFVYLVGSAADLSGNLPSGWLDLGGGMLDLWVAKFHRDGTPIYQTVIGGKADDAAYSVAVRHGVVYILGETWSVDFPGAPGGAGENDALALALSADGSTILWARRLGGSDQDSGRSIALRGAEIYLTGITWSADFLPGTAQGDADGFLTRLDLTGKVQWVSVFGGRGLDAPFGLAAGEGGIWVTGETLSGNLAGALSGDGDIFALRYSPEGAQQFASLYGGPGEDVAYAAALAPDGSLYLTGDTQSAQLAGAKGQYGGETDAVLMHISASGGLLSTSYLGGAGIDTGSALAVLPGGSVIVAGGTSSASFPDGYALSTGVTGGQDAFMAIFAPDGQLAWVGSLGAAGDDIARAMGVTSSGVVLAGSFSEGSPSYLRLVPATGLPGVTLPTSAPPQPTATNAATATAWPTETPRPTETGDAADPTPISNAPVQASVTQPASATATGSPPAAQSVELLPTGAEVTTAADRPPVRGLSTPEAASPAPVDAGAPPARPNGWIVSGLIMIAVLIGAAFWYWQKVSSR